jgi:uncharacterized BrkB/YihY/UPF0761 family membrane protein
MMNAVTGDIEAHNGRAPLLMESGHQLFDEESSQAPPNPRVQRMLFIWVCTMTVIYCWFFMFSLAAVIMSPMMFDAGQNFFNSTAFLMVLGLPVVLVMSVICMWRYYRCHDYRKLAIASLTPVAYIAPFVGLCLIYES